MVKVKVYYSCRMPEVGRKRRAQCTKYQKGYHQSTKAVSFFKGQLREHHMFMLVLLDHVGRFFPLTLFPAIVVKTITQNCSIVEVSVKSS